MRITIEKPEPSPAEIGGYLLDAESCWERGCQLLRVDSAVVEAVSQVTRVAAGALMASPTNFKRGDVEFTRRAVAQKDAPLALVLSCRVAVGVSALTMGAHLAISAALKLSPLHIELPSVRAFSNLVKIPKAVILAYLLVHTAPSLQSKRSCQKRFDTLRREYALAEDRELVARSIDLRYGKEVRNLIEAEHVEARVVRPKEIEAAMVRETIENVVDATIMVAVVVQMALEALGHSKVTKILNAATNIAIGGFTAWSLKNTARDKIKIERKPPVEIELTPLEDKPYSP